MIRFFILELVAAFSTNFGKYAETYCKQKMNVTNKFMVVFVVMVI